ncbi:MAG: T9SS type A sorting domain-containing protein, partial [Bacteroidales bacterium]|nr:T9SS type A sorting domain-containing protein [Bacteroidales bacterium]
GTIWITGISGFAEIEVIGSLGTTMKTITNDGQNSLSIDLYDFQPGVYQIKFMGESGSVVKRVVKK